MSSSSLGSSVPAPEAVQLLVSSLADDSSVVREASMVSLRDIASLNPLLVLDCCYAVSRGGRRRFGNMAGVFQVMAFSVGALEKGESDPVYMGKLAKIATSEIISSKELNADWQRQASGLLVSIGTHFPDLMMEEIFLHLSGPASASAAMVQTLADFASSDALQFTPRLKGVLSRVLPILGNVQDVHRPIFANAFKCWSQAVWLYTSDFPLDGDVMSLLNSVFELLFRVWAISRDHKVRVFTVEALGQMVGLITRTQLKSALPRLIPAILELYKKDHDDALLATCSLHNLLNASLLSESGPPLLDFEDLTVVLSTLLPVIGLSSESNSVGRKTYNEVQRCFLTVGLVYPEDLFTFLLNKCKLKEDPLSFGALCALKHLLPRLFEAWHSKQPLLEDAARSLLDEQSLAVRKALSELIVGHCAIGETDNQKKYVHRVLNEMSSSLSVKSTPEIEKKYVHRVYDAIAPHFSSTRFAKWPKVAAFLESLPSGSVVLDAGCGNGKYLGLNPSCFFIGCDISHPLIKICLDKGQEVLVADAVNLPYREEFGDAAISIAVLHHLSTEDRRKKAIEELVRVVKPGGFVLITVWAAEQEDKSLLTKWTPLSPKYVEEWVGPVSPMNSPCVRNNPFFGLESIPETEVSTKEQKAENSVEESLEALKKNQQEYFVPWHLPYHRAEVSGASASALASGLAKKDDRKGAVVYNRYYHVFSEGELERLASGVGNAKIVDRFYDKSNWCIILQKEALNQY